VPDASLRSVAVAPDHDLWFTENFANRIGRMAPNGKVIGEYAIPVPGAGPRAILALPDGRLFFSAHDIGAIGEVRPYGRAERRLTAPARWCRGPAAGLPANLVAARPEASAYRRFLGRSAIPEWAPCGPGRSAPAGPTAPPRGPSPRSLRGRARCAGSTPCGFRRCAGGPHPGCSGR